MFLFTQFGPALAALVVTWYSNASVREWARKIVRWRVAPRWYIIAIGLPLLLVGVQSAVFGLAGGPIFPSRIIHLMHGRKPCILYL
jgi:uncharacterized protein